MAFSLWKIALIFTQTKVNFEISFAFRDQVCYTVNSWKWKISTRLDYSVEFSGLCVLELWLSEQKLFMVVIGLSFVNCRKSKLWRQNIYCNFFCLFISSWVIQGCKTLEWSDDATHWFGVSVVQDNIWSEWKQKIQNIKTSQGRVIPGTDGQHDMFLTTCCTAMLQNVFTRYNTRVASCSNILCKAR